MELTDSQKTLLAKLKYRDPVRYKEKLDVLGVQESEIWASIMLERKRRREVSEVKQKPAVANGFVYYMGGSPYWSPTPVIKNTRPISVTPQKEKTKSSFKSVHKRKTERKKLFLVDGDNNPIQNMNGYEVVKKKKNTHVLVCVADEGLEEKYVEAFGVDTKYVVPDDQAVDNQIKSIVGNVLKNHEYDEVVIISKDQGYKGKIEKWKKVYDLSPKDLRLCENIKEALR